MREANTEQILAAIEAETGHKCHVEYNTQGEPEYVLDIKWDTEYDSSLIQGWEWV
jgi:hypothetical protein